MQKEHGRLKNRIKIELGDITQSEDFLKSAEPCMAVRPGRQRSRKDMT